MRSNSSRDEKEQQTGFKLGQEDCRLTGLAKIMMLKSIDAAVMSLLSFLLGFSVLCCNVRPFQL